MDAYDIFKKISFNLKFDPSKSIFRRQNDSDDKKALFAQKNNKRKFKSRDEAEKALRQIRRENRINVQGSDVPAVLKSFDELISECNLNDVFASNLLKLGFSELTPVQMQAIPIMLQNRELMTCAPTGSGKTLAFLIPIITHLLSSVPEPRGFKAVILAPSRELANQIFLECEKLTASLRVQPFIIKKTQKISERLSKKGSQRYNILITTPYRLIYLMETSNCISLSGVDWLVIDEADKLFEDGKQSFKEQLAIIFKACDSENCKRALFSATYSHDVEQWCVNNLNDVIQLTVGSRNAAVNTVDQKLIYAGTEEGKLIGLRNIFREGFEPPILIFVQSKERAAELFKELLYDNVMVGVIHSDLTQAQRDKIVNAFRSGKIWVLICTDVMGRGIDFKGVNLVVNYDFPTSAVSYIHRIGRTGRANRKGKAVTFFTDVDMVNIRSIVNVMKQAGCEVPDYLLLMKKPRKKIRQKLRHHAPKRRHIYKVDKYTLKKAREIVNSKRKRKKKRKQLTGDKKFGEGVVRD